MDFVGRRYDLTTRITKSDLRVECMNMFLHSDDGSYYPLKIKDVKVGEQDNGDPINHKLRFCCHYYLKRSYEDMTYSEIYKDFFNETNTRISYDFFRRHICPCLKAPTYENCVDLIASVIHYKQREVFNSLTKSPIIRDAVSRCTCLIHSNNDFTKLVNNLFSGHWGEIVARTCCAKEPYPTPTY